MKDATFNLLITDFEHSCILHYTTLVGWMCWYLLNAVWCLMTLATKKVTVLQVLMKPNIHTSCINRWWNKLLNLAKLRRLQYGNVTCLDSQEAKCKILPFMVSCDYKIVLFIK